MPLLTDFDGITLMAEFTRLEISDGIARLSLNRPEKRNALKREFIVELDEAVKQVRDDSSARVLVLAAEAFNTAIEYTVDYISTERHPLAGRAKDAASAGVFLTAIAGGVAWVVVLVRIFAA